MGRIFYVIAKHRIAVLWQSPGRAPYYKTHARYFCTCVEKKAHTSKRVSVIACDNVISKAKLCDAYTGIFRTCREKHNLIKILTFNKINNIILAFYDELLKHPFGCFCFGEIFITRAKHYVIPSEAWESPGTDTLLNKAVPFREMRRTTSLLKSHYRGR